MMLFVRMSGTGGGGGRGGVQKQKNETLVLGLVQGKLQFPPLYYIKKMSKNTWVGNLIAPVHDT